MLLDYITGKPVKDTPKEQVRQRIARALFHEYGISVDDMVPDFKMSVDGRLEEGRHRHLRRRASASTRCREPATGRHLREGAEDGHQGRLQDARSRAGEEGVRPAVRTR